MSSSEFSDHTLTPAQIAAEELVVYDEALSPHRETIDHEVGRLSISHAILEDERHEHLAAQANVRLIRKAVNQLPLATNNGSKYERVYVYPLDDQAEVRTLQSNLVWYRETWPHYVVGERPTESPKWTQLLLIDASHAHNIMKVTVRTTTFHENKEAAQARETLPFTDAERKDMLDPASLKLIASHKTPGTVDIEKIKRTLASFGSGVPHAEQVGDEISAEDMEQFDVYTRLIRLADAFGKESEITQLLTGVTD